MPVFHFDPATGVVRVGARVTRLRPRTARVMEQLLGAAEAVVSRDELLQTVWADVRVTAGTVNQSIVELRRALGDDPDEPRILRTLRCRGYQLVLRVADEPQGLFVGRDAELGTLREAFAATLGGTRQLVLLAGDAGLGKTTLLRRFADEIAGDSVLLRGQAVQRSGPGAPWEPILDALATARREPGLMPLLACLRREAPGWIALAPGLADTAVPPPPAGGEQLRLQLALALEAAGAERPVVLAIEDLHHADSSTLDLLTFLASREAPARLLVVGTLRPAAPSLELALLSDVARDPHLRGRGRWVLLGPFTPDETARYVAHRLPGCAAALPGQVHARTAGHPLFVQALADALHAVHDGGDAAAAPLPPTLRTLLASDLARCDAATRALLDAAAVLGTRVHAADLAQVVAVAPDEADAQLFALARDGRFVEPTVPAGTYRFRHAIYREVIQAELPPLRAIALHGAAVRVLTARAETELDALAADLSLHAEAAGDVAAAGRWAERAAHAALAHAAPGEALAHLTRARDLLDAQPAGRARDEAALRLWLATLRAARVRGGDFDPEHPRCCAEIDRLAQLLGDRHARATAALWLATHQAYDADVATAEHTTAEAVRLARRADDPGAVAGALATRGNLLAMTGRIRQARRALDEALALISTDVEAPLPAGDEDPLRHVLRTDVILSAMEDRRARVVECADMLQRRVARTGWGPSRRDALVTLATAWALLGDAAGTRAMADALRAANGPRPAPLEEQLQLLLDGMAAAVAGRPAPLEAAPLFEHGPPALRIMLRALVAEAHARGGDPARGLRHAEQGLAFVRLIGERTHEAELHRVAAACLAALHPSDPLPARAALDEAERVARHHGATLFAARARDDRARLDAARDARVA